MIRQRFVAFLMIALQVAALEYMLFRLEWFPLALGAAGFVGMFGLVQIPLRRTAIIAITLAVAVFIDYGIQLFLFSYRLPVLPFLTQYTHVLAWFLLAMQVVLLFLCTANNRLPVYFPLFGTAVMAYAGLPGRHGAIDPPYHVAVFAFIGLMVAFWATTNAPTRTDLSRTLRVRGRLLQGAVLLGSLSVAFVASSVIGAYRDGINDAFLNIVGVLPDQSRVGFSTQSRLGSIEGLQNDRGDEVALRVRATSGPGYLRGRAYDTYARNQWEVTAKDARVSRVTDVSLESTTDERQTFFQLRPAPGPYTQMTISPANSFEGCLFAPLNTVYLGLPSLTPSRDANDNLRGPGFSSGTEYEVVTAAHVEQELTESEHRRLAEPPADIDPGVRALAAQLFADCRTVQEKANAVVSYFDRNYTYQLGIRVPNGKDPVTYFLLEKPPAYCEYFATGAAILLRLGDVPCRYVTGFVAAERNRIGGYWIARNRDAHAWVEVYDDAQHTWVTIEPTVAAGLPSSEANERPGPFAQAWDCLVYTVKGLKAALITGQWRGLTRYAGLLAWALVPIGLFALALAGKRLLRRRPGKRPKRVRQRPLSAEERQLLRLRRRVDRCVGRHGFQRRPDETVHAFADRIAAHVAAHPADVGAKTLQQAANWYRVYAEARFRDTLPDALDHLRTIAHQ